RKRLGLGNAVLLGWIDDETVSWCLLVTPGDHPAFRLETMADALTRPIEVTGYELVRTTRTGKAKPVWSWRMTAETYQTWRDRILIAVRHRDLPACRQGWESLYSAPGFALIREQVGKLVQFFRREWERVQASPFPFQPRPLYYVRRMAVKDLGRRKSRSKMEGAG
ncbi:MAG: hypothetical protein AB1514_12400, partial [Pseudomonadota bacterium]